jgi:hypothetical protein
MQSTLYYFWILLKFEFFFTDSQNSSNNKFYRNPSEGGEFYTEGRTDMTKLIVAFWNFANTSKDHVLLFKIKIGCNNYTKPIQYNVTDSRAVSYRKICEQMQTKKVPERTQFDVPRRTTCLSDNPTSYAHWSHSFVPAALRHEKSGTTACSRQVFTIHLNVSLVQMPLWVRGSIQDQ